MTTGQPSMTRYGGGGGGGGKGGGVGVSVVLTVHLFSLRLINRNLKKLISSFSLLCP